MYNIRDNASIVTDALIWLFTHSFGGYGSRRGFYWAINCGPQHCIYFIHVCLHAVGKWLLILDAVLCSHSAVLILVILISGVSYVHRLGGIPIASFELTGFFPRKVTLLQSCSCQLLEIRTSQNNGFGSIGCRLVSNVLLVGWLGFSLCRYRISLFLSSCSQWPNYPALIQAKFVMSRT